MSTDFELSCHDCRQWHHLGQRSAVTRFGHGSNDEQGRNDAAAFAFHHLGHDLRVEDAPADFAECRGVDRVEWRPVTAEDVAVEGDSFRDRMGRIATLRGRFAVEGWNEGPFHAGAFDILVKKEQARAPDEG